MDWTKITNNFRKKEKRNVSKESETMLSVQEMEQLVQMDAAGLAEKLNFRLLLERTYVRLEEPILWVDSVHVICEKAAEEEKKKASFFARIKKRLTGRGEKKPLLK